MKLRRCSALLLGAILLGFTTSLAAQAAMTGIVREDSSARPLEGVEVLINGTPHRTMTGANGRYLLEGLPSGIYQAIFRAVGHIPVRMDVLLTAGEATRANATLVRSDVVLDPIVVTGSPLREVGLAGRGFEERRRMGFGQFYDSEELRKLEHLRLSDLLRRKGGIEIARARFHNDSPFALYAVNSRYRNVGGQLNCMMSIYLDGRMLWKGGNQYTQEELKMNPPPDLSRFMSVTSFEGIEVYPSAAGMPVEFGGTSGQCGAVVFWTRRAP